MDLPNTRLWRDDPRPMASSPRIVIPTAPSMPSCSEPSRCGLARTEHAATSSRRPTLTAPARADVSEAWDRDEETAFQIEQRNPTKERRGTALPKNSLTKKAPYKAGYSNARPHQPGRRILLHRTAGPYRWVTSALGGCPSRQACRCGRCHKPRMRTSPGPGSGTGHSTSEMGRSALQPEPTRIVAMTKLVLHTRLTSEPRHARTLQPALASRPPFGSESRRRSRRCGGSPG
jgi:hypothetical protein